MRSPTPLNAKAPNVSYAVRVLASEEGKSKDVALVIRPTDDHKGVHVLRKRSPDSPVELGEVRPIAHGQPIAGEVVSMTPREGHPFVCDVKTEVEPQHNHRLTDSVSTRPGPAQVASARYRQNWETIWGTVNDDGAHTPSSNHGTMASDAFVGDSGPRSIESGSLDREIDAREAFQGNNLDDGLGDPLTDGLSTSEEAEAFFELLAAAGSTNDNPPNLHAEASDDAEAGPLDAQAFPVTQTDQADARLQRDLHAAIRASGRGDQIRTASLFDADDFEDDGVPSPAPRGQPCHRAKRARHFHGRPTEKTDPTSTPRS